MEKSKLCFEKTGAIEQLVPIEAFSMSDLRKQRCKNFLKEHQYQMNKTLSFYGIGGIAPVLNETHNPDVFHCKIRYLLFASNTDRCITP